MFSDAFTCCHCLLHLLVKVRHLHHWFQSAIHCTIPGMPGYLCVPVILANLMETLADIK